MSMARYESGDIRKLGSQGHYRIRKVIAGCARLQPHMSSEHNRFRAFTLRFDDCAPHRFNGMLKIDSNGKLPWKPERHAGRCDSDNCNLDAVNFPNDKRLNLPERMLRIGERARQSSV